MWPDTLGREVKSRWQLLRFVKFLELRETRRREAREEEDTTKLQHGEAIAALRTR
jgi:hypothetical protein